MHFDFDKHIFIFFLFYFDMDSLVDTFKIEMHFKLKGGWGGAKVPFENLKTLLSINFSNLLISKYVNNSQMANFHFKLIIAVFNKRLKLIKF